MLRSLAQSILIVAILSLSQLSFGQLKKDSSEKAVRFAAVPLINYNRTQGLILGALTSLFYKVNKKDTLSPFSSSAIGGFYTGQKSWIVGITQQLYLSHDLWRIRGVFVFGRINYQYYNPDANDAEGQYEDYGNDILIAIGQIQHKVWRRIYAGLYGEYNNTKTYFHAKNDSLDERNLSNIGYIISNDSRDNVYFPTKGIFANFKNQFYRTWLGSNNNFIRYQINYNQFFDLIHDQRHVLIGRINMNIASGDVPFQGQGIVGGDDIRGYSQGKYRGNQVYALQSEYRWNFRNSKFGVVAFFGLASAVEYFSDIFSSEVLPGGGAGIRFRIIPSMKVNIGADVGFGKDDYSITFRIGEAFGR